VLLCLVLLGQSSLNDAGQPPVFLYLVASFALGQQQPFRRYPISVAPIATTPVASIQEVSF